MKKRKLKIINFLYLSDEKYNKILKYRNQEYIRKVSLSSELISEENHREYKKLLEKKDKYFAYLVTSNDNDYGIITFKKVKENTFEIGEYLVKEEYKYEGGGIVNRYCIILLCNKLNIKYLKVIIKEDNIRGHRSGKIAEIHESKYEDGLLMELSEVYDYNDEKILREKGRRLFDKMYEIEHIEI